MGKPGFPLVALSILLTMPSSLTAATATLSGRVRDTTGAVVPGAKVDAVNQQTGGQHSVLANDQGLYVISNVAPGVYAVTCQASGFSTLQKRDVEVHVAEVVTMDLTLRVGELAQTVTVEAGRTLVKQQSAQVDTLVDRQFIENLPLNGRSFNTLVQLTPGVVQVKPNFGGRGQFSVNGQRANANNYMVDGASGNTFAGLTPDVLNFAGGASPSTTAFGGTNNLASVDAIEEFRIQTSTYAPEYGRQPGAQISIATRSGTNAFHGTASWFFRNDVLDANDWFANRAGIGKGALRQNDFGGVFGGPILKDRTFFFFSYEGLRLRQPRFELISVPAASVHDQAASAVRPIIDVFPRGNVPGSLNTTNSTEMFQANVSAPSELDSYSIRLDHRLGKWVVFGRYANTSSFSDSPRAGQPYLDRLLDVSNWFVTTGATWSVNAHTTNELRVNWTTNRGINAGRVFPIGGNRVPSESELLPRGRSFQDSSFTLAIGNPNFGFFLGPTADNRIRQVQVVESLSWVRGSHEMKFGADWRWLSPIFNRAAYSNRFSITTGFNPLFTGTPDSMVVAQAANGLTFRFQNLSLFAQDMWRVNPRLTLTFGLRWEYNPAPVETTGRPPLVVRGVKTPSTIVVAPDGTELWRATTGNFGPRLGLAYRLSDGLVVRGGVGLFYDLGSDNAGNTLNADGYRGTKTLTRPVFPLSTDAAEAPGLRRGAPYGRIVGFDPDLELPYSLQWNIALEKSLGTHQTVSTTYVASIGRRLIRQGRISNPTPIISRVDLNTNGSTSDYHALQLQFQRRFSRSLQLLGSYSWSHSIDNATDPTSFNVENQFLNLDLERGNSETDTRHVFSAGFSYNVPVPAALANNASRAMLGGWGLDGVVQAHSGFPINITTGQDPLGELVSAALGFGRPDVVAGHPLWIADSSQPMGRRLNPAAFVIPPAGRQGTLGRNAIDGNNLFQFDLSLRRRFVLREPLSLMFRADFFNLLNHPNFDNPNSGRNNALFGFTTQMLSQALAPGGEAGGFSSIYNIGGPRSIQFSLKLQF
jgi:hypothetical protein